MSSIPSLRAVYSYVFALAILFSQAHVDAQVVSVTDFASVGRSVQRSTITEFKDELIFAVGVDNTQQRELWAFDGIESRRIADGFLGESEIAISEFTEFQGRLYFSADRGAVGKELYRYDGESVSLAVDIQTGTESSFPVNFFKHNDALFFSAKSGDSFNNLWKYDGAEATRIAQFDDPRASVVTGSTYQGDLYFGADNDNAGMELWKYDGRAVEMVADINPGTGDSYPRNFVVVGDELFFKANTRFGQEVWKFDGSEASLVKDVNPGPVSSDPRHLTEVNGELFFSAVSYRKRNVLVVDGDKTETIVAGGGPIQIGDELYTIRGNRASGTEINELYTLDGEFFRSTVESAGPFLTFQDTLYFSCSCDERELYKLAEDGDANFDGAVTFEDFLSLSKNYGESGSSWKQGDFDRDGVVLFDDFLLQSDNFGGVPVKKSVVATPEPGGQWLGWICFAVLLRFAGRRK